MRFFSIASGNIDGGYYEAAQAICNAVNGVDDPRCSAEPTSGSLYNLMALADDQVDMALVQSDWHKSAYEGVDVFAGRGPMSDLRSVMSLYPEAVTVLARENAGIRRTIDLLGKRIDIGHPTSGRYATLSRLLQAVGFGLGDFAEVTNLTDGSAIEELCAGLIDAVILVVGHPNTAVARALDRCDISIEPFSGPNLDRVFADSTDYAPATISRGVYPGLNADVPTYAVTATLVARADVDPELVGAVVRRTLGDLDELRARSRLLANLNPDQMMTDGLTAPLHDAAAAAFATFAQTGAGER